MLSPIKTLFTYFPLIFFLRVFLLLLIFVAVGFIVNKQYKNNKIDKRKAIMILLLVFYILAVYFFTVLGRRTKDGYSCNFDIISAYVGLYLYPSAKLILEVVLNVLMFVPVGAFSCFVFNKCRILFGTLIGLSFSIIIEISQLLLSNGFCTIIDIIHNSLGALLGALITLLIIAIYNKFKGRRKVG